MSAPLRGVRVLEFSQIYAGPLAGLVLADLGADVVKIEPPSGEQTRHGGSVVPGTSKMFQWYNRGKRSLVLDLNDPAARRVVHRIVPSFDIAIMNYQAAVAERLQIDYVTLSKIREDIIYAEISGFGPHGPMSGLPLIDLVAQAYSGIMADEGVMDDFGVPRGTRAMNVDATTGFLTAIGILSALHYHRETGHGQLVTTSLLRSAMALIGATVMREPVHDSVVLGSAVDEARELFGDGMDYAEVLAGYREKSGALSISRMPFLSGYMAKDGPIFIGAFTVEHRAGVRAILGLSDDGSDEPDFDPLDPAGAALAKELRQKIISIMRKRTVSDWMNDFQAAGVPAAPVHFPAELADDPHSSTFMVSLEDELTGPQMQLGSLFELSKASVRARGPAPVLGRHTEEILLEEGFSPDEIAALRQSGAAV